MSGKDQEIQTFVILDLETIGLPREHGERSSIKEFSLCAFSAQYLMDKDDYSNLALNNVSSVKIPKLPEVLNKITLMMHPSGVNNDGFEELSGKLFKVKNYKMLQNESPFDEGTAECINNFLGCLTEPICLVAHNGYRHDFLGIPYAYKNINKAFPSGIFCVDTLNQAFREIDKTYEITKSEIVDGTIAHDSQINLYGIDEASLREKLSRNFSCVVDKMRSLQLTDYNLSEMLSVKRELFVDELIFNRFPARGTYRLVDIYMRCFPGHVPLNLHSAEGDVNALTRLVLHYGIDFLAYAEERKKLFADVPILGTSTN